MLALNQKEAKKAYQLTKNSVVIDVIKKSYLRKLFLDDYYLKSYFLHNCSFRLIARNSKLFE